MAAGYKESKLWLTSLNTGDYSQLTGYRYAMEAYDATMLAALAAIVAHDDAGDAIAGSLYDVSKR